MKDRSEANGPAGGKTASELLDLYFLDLRSHLLEVAAGLDRVERAKGGETAITDPRVANLLDSLDVLKGRGPGRACRFLELFSDPS